MATVSPQTLTSPRIPPDYCQMSSMLFWNCRPLTMMTFTAKPCAMAISTRCGPWARSAVVFKSLNRNCRCVGRKIRRRNTDSQRITCVSAVHREKTNIQTFCFSDATLNLGQNDGVLYLVWVIDMDSAAHRWRFVRSS